MYVMKQLRRGGLSKYSLKLAREVELKMNTNKMQ